MGECQQWLRGTRRGWLRVLGERLRSDAERQSIREVLEKCLKVSPLVESTLYASAQEGVPEKSFVDAAAKAEKMGGLKRGGRRGFGANHRVDARHETIVCTSGGMHELTRSPPYSSAKLDVGRHPSVNCLRFCAVKSFES